MATAESIAIRREQAIIRLKAATTALGAEVDFSRRERDAALEEVSLLERIASGLESIQAKPEPPAPDPVAEPRRKK